MIQIRSAPKRGEHNSDWLQSRHSFSFGQYYDPAHMGFCSLRVINEDRVAPGGGFPAHPHADMEIITLVLSGSLEHRDSLGNGSVINAGDVQKMSAGTGIVHSEFNPSDTEASHFLQIWIIPDRRGLLPCYEQVTPAPELRDGQLQLIAGPRPARNQVTLRQDASIYLLDFSSADQPVIDHPLEPGRHAWVQVIDGKLEVNGKAVQSGDGIAVVGESVTRLQSLGPARIVLFDLACKSGG